MKKLMALFAFINSSRKKLFHKGEEELKQLFLSKMNELK
jgi:hypothetical protein